MTHKELVKEMRTKLFEALMIGPANQLDLRLCKLMDDFEESYLKLLEKNMTIEIKGLDEPPIFLDKED